MNSLPLILALPAAALAAFALPTEDDVWLEDASKLPEFSAPEVKDKLAWPFDGDFKAQKLWNNYTQANQTYVHAALDLIHEAGTEVRAVAGGTVRAIATNYPDWKTHHFFIVSPEGKTDEGWCYTHVDPDTYTFEVGDEIKAGQVVGKLVDFYIGERKAIDHLHLHYVKFEEKEGGKVDFHSLCDPLYYFDFEDTQKPVITAPIRFVADETTDEFAQDSKGVATVSGKVDIIAALSDNAYRGQAGNWGVPVVTYEIRKKQGAKRSWGRLALDQRGPIEEPTNSRFLYEFGEATKAWREDVPPWPSSMFMRVTNTDGDGVIEPEDAAHSWDTQAVGEDGKPMFPNGRYTVTIRAWDLKENMAERIAEVIVKN